MTTHSTILLFTALAKGNKLKQLYLGINDITDEACDVIATVLKYNTSLVELVIRHNLYISAEAAQRLVQALKSNNTLEVLQLSYHYYSEDIKKIRSLQKEVNENRLSRGYQTKLEILI